MKGEGSTTLREAGSFDGGASWIAYPEEGMQRASHALDGEDGLWLVDPLDADDLDEWLAERGEVAGVLVLFDRHSRDAGAIANRHDVDVHLPDGLDALADDVDAPVTVEATDPTGEGDERGSDDESGRTLLDEGSRFRPVVERRFWREYALVSPGGDTLVVPEAVGTAPHFVTGEERLGVHPALRLRPPRVALGDVGPERVLVGHGDPILEDASAALTDALAGSRRRTPRLYAEAARGLLPE